MGNARYPGLCAQCENSIRVYALKELNGDSESAFRQAVDKAAEEWALRMAEDVAEVTRKAAQSSGLNP
jgi:hypothetical protein